MNNHGIARSLVTFAPSPRRWHVGLQAGLAMAIPVVVFTLLGNTASGLQASIGAFTALYCVALSPFDRVRVLPFVVAAFVASVSLGALLSGSAWLLAAGLVVVGSAAIVVSQGLRLGPPGPMMFVLAYGAAGLITAPADNGGAGFSGATLVLLVSAGCALAYLLVAASLLIPAVRDVDVPRALGRPRFQFDEVTRLVSARMLVALVVSVLVAVPLGVHHGYWISAATLAILSVGHSRRLSLIRGVHRVLGTLVGSVAVLLLAWWGPGGVALGMLLGAMQFLIELVVVRHYALALVLITPLAITVGTAAAGVDPADVVGERIGDTVLGTVIAAVVLLVSWPAAARRTTD